MKLSELTRLGYRICGVIYLKPVGYGMFAVWGGRITNYCKAVDGTVLVYASADLVEGLGLLDQVRDFEAHHSHKINNGSDFLLPYVEEQTI